MRKPVMERLPVPSHATLHFPSRMNSTDSNPNSPNAGTTYVYYSYFCNLPSGTCTDGIISNPQFRLRRSWNHIRPDRASPSALQRWSAAR